MMPVAAAPNPIVFAHRGGAQEAVENSFSAFSDMQQIGVTHIETDAQVTADGQVVLSHDSTLDRCFDGSGEISNYTYEELLQFRNEADEQIPLLSDVLEQFPDLYFNIDAKTDEVAEPLVEVLSSHNALDRTLVASFSERRLERMRLLAGPQLATSLGVNAVVRLLLAAETVSNAETWHVPGPRHQARAVQVPEKSKGIRVVSPRFIATAHTAGLAVHVWTVNDVDKMDKLFDWGVDGIVTDVPSVAKQLLVDRGQWNLPDGEELIQ